MRDTLRDSATIGVEQNRPILTPGVANFADCEATARSQLATNWQPAAVAVACTAAITGCGSATICCITALHMRHDVLEIAAAAIVVAAARD